MAFPSQQEIDIIATQILLDAKSAILSLKAWNNSVTDATGKIRLFKELIRATAAQMNGDMKSAEAAVKKFSKALNINPQLIKKAGDDLRGVGDAGEKSGKQVQNAFTKAVHPINVLRLALGVLVSMLIFQVIQAIQNTFKLMIDSVRETELAVYNLINAERRLSEMGIGITPKDLDDIIDRLREINPILSKIQAEELVSRIATNVAPALKLSREEIEKMAVATSLLFIRNKALGKSFDEVEAQLTNAFLTGKVSQGINQLGVKISDQIVRDEALRMGLVKTADEFDNLSGEMEAHIKSVAMLEVVYKNAIQDQQSITDYMETTDAQIEKTKKTWTDLLTISGKTYAPLVAEGLKIIINALELIIKLLDAVDERNKRWVARIVALAEASKDISQYAKLGGGADMFEKFQSTFDKVMEGYKELEDKPDTATGAIEDMYSAIESNEDAEKALKEIDEKIQDIILDAQQAREDLDIRLGQKQQDLETEYDRKTEDAAREHAQKLVDIDLDARQKAEDAKRKLREDEKKAEQDLLQKLKELRQRFLLDLEEALHNRDARQVLRLIREYKLEKQNILDRKKLDDQQRKDKLAEDLKAIEIERQRRIENENIEYQRRLSDLAMAKAREQEELQLWYQREQEDIERNIKQKIEKLLAGYVAEGKIHESEQAKIYAILAKYFSKDMALVDYFVSYMMNRMSMLSSMQYPISAPYASYGQAPQTTTQKAKTDPMFQRHNFAEGGTMIADRPTVAQFGERGLEAATFTPLNRTGRDVGKLFGNLQGGGVNGEITVAVDLSPDLEGRIVNRSMDGVANVIGKVNRRKL